MSRLEWREGVNDAQLPQKPKGDFTDFSRTPRFFFTLSWYLTETKIDRVNKRVIIHTRQLLIYTCAIMQARVSMPSHPVEPNDTVCGLHLSG